MKNKSVNRAIMLLNNAIATQVDAHQFQVIYDQSSYEANASGEEAFNLIVSFKTFIHDNGKTTPQPVLFNIICDGDECFLSIGADCEMYDIIPENVFGYMWFWQMPIDSDEPVAWKHRDRFEFCTPAYKEPGADNTSAAYTVPLYAQPKQFELDALKQDLRKANEALDQVKQAFQSANLPVPKVITTALAQTGDA